MDAKAGRPRSRGLSGRGPLRHRAGMDEGSGTNRRLALGHFLLGRRLERRIRSQRSLGTLANVDPKTVGKAERGEYISDNSLMQISLALDVAWPDVKAHLEGKRPIAGGVSGPDHVEISNRIRDTLGVEAAIEYLQRVITQQAEEQDQAAVTRARDALSREAEQS